jgi:hypothetical protein
MTAKRITANRKGKGRKSVVPVPHYAPAPSSRRVVMSYVAPVAVTESAVYAGSTSFYRLNSIYDPDYSGVGTSVLGYTDWMDFFARYRVLKATVRFTGFVSGLSANGVGMIVLAPIPRSATVPANLNSWPAIPFGQYRVIAPVDGGNNKADFTITYDMAEVSRITKEQYMDEAEYQGTKGTNPTREIFLFLGMRSINSGTIATMAGLIEISYEVELSDPFVLQ